MQVIRKVNVNETLEFFMELGIVPKDRNGYIYPNSDQAASVLDVLREEIERLKIRILLSCHIEKIEKKNGGFFIHTDQGTVETDALILAAGSKAAPSTGSDGSGYEYARQLGHSIIKPLPALVQLRCQGNMYKQMAGIRTEAEVSLQADGITLEDHSSGRRKESCFRHGRASDHRLWSFRYSGLSGEPVCSKSVR